MGSMVGRRPRRHTGPADRKAPLRVGTQEQHVGGASGRSAASSDVRSLAPIDLVGRTSPARLHLRVRFGVTDEVPT
jgi:hypothetical protein